MTVLTSAQELPGEAFTRRAITVVLALITALTFAFGFGNVWALGRSLGVPALIAPLVGPAVDLSVAGLLIGLRHLSMTGIPRRQLRSARILLATCGAAELALNIAGPVAAGAYGRAAFDAVGPLLLIGWAEAGPGLLRHLYASPSGRAEPPVHGVARADDNAPGRIGTASRPEPANGGADQLGDRRAGHRGVAGLDDLLVQARGIDQEHRARYGRPVSAETLRKQMRIGSMRARGLVQQVRRARQPDRDPSPDRHGPGPLHRDGSLHSAPVRPGEHMTVPD
jgi:hypothetical protein